MELSRKVASAITTYAQNNHADVIVFEYLKMKGKVTGKKRQKLHLWRKSGAENAGWSRRRKKRRELPPLDNLP